MSNFIQLLLSVVLVSQISWLIEKLSRFSVSKNWNEYLSCFKTADTIEIQLQIINKELFMSMKSIQNDIRHHWKW